MSSSYDFKNIEREASNLQKNLDKFLTRQDNIVSKIGKLKFDENNYGEKAIDNRIKIIFRDAKRQLENEFNNSYSELKTEYNRSLSRVVEKAKELNDNVRSYNSSLNALTRLNQNYESKNYFAIINESSSNFIGSQKLYIYFLLLKANSYGFLTKEKFSNFDINDIKLFDDYVSFCKENNAKNHMNDASFKCFEFLYEILRKNSFEVNERYEYLKKCIVLKDTISAEKLDLEKVNFVYQEFVNAFNSMSQKYYDNFEYDNFVSIINDSHLINASDIKLTLLQNKNTDISIIKLNFFMEQSKLGSFGDLKKAILDLRPILNSSQNKKYITTVVNLLDQDKIELFEILIDQINNDWSYYDFVKYCDWLLVKNKDDKFFYDILVNNFIDRTVASKDQLPLLYTIEAVLKMNSAINIDCLENKNKFYNICLSLITSNKNYLSSLNEEIKNDICELFNKAYKETTNKIYKKNILKVKKSTSLNYDLVVKLKKIDFKPLNNAKILIVVGVAFALISIITIILCLTLL